MIFAILLFGRSSAAYACPDLDGALNAAVVHILAADSAATDRDFATAEESLGCERVSAAQIARYFVVRGGRAELDAPGSGLSLLASARALDPTVWEAQLGPELRATWQGAAVAPDGSLMLDTNADGGWVDGRHVTAWPAVAFGGWHVVQVITLDGKTVMYGRSVNLPAGNGSLVSTGLPESGATVAETAAPSRKRRVISPAWLIGSVALAAAGGGLAIAANEQRQRVPEYDSLDSLDLAWNRERQFAYGAYAAWGAAGVLGGLSFVLP